MEANTIPKRDKSKPFPSCCHENRVDVCIKSQIEGTHRAAQHLSRALARCQRRGWGFFPQPCLEPKPGTFDKEALFSCLQIAPDFFFSFLVFVFFPAAEGPESGLHPLGSFRGRYAYSGGPRHVNASSSASVAPGPGRVPAARAPFKRRNPPHPPHHTHTHTHTPRSSRAPAAPSLFAVQIPGRFFSHGLLMAAPPPAPRAV